MKTTVLTFLAALACMALTAQEAPAPRSWKLTLPLASHTPLVGNTLWLGVETELTDNLDIEVQVGHRYNFGLYDNPTSFSPRVRTYVTRSFGSPESGGAWRIGPAAGISVNRHETTGYTCPDTGATSSDSFYDCDNQTTTTYVRQTNYAWLGLTAGRRFQISDRLGLAANVTTGLGYMERTENDFDPDPVRRDFDFVGDQWFRADAKGLNNYLSFDLRATYTLR